MESPSVMVDNTRELKFLGLTLSGWWYRTEKYESTSHLLILGTIEHVKHYWPVMQATMAPSSDHILIGPSNSMPSTGTHGARADGRPRDYPVIVAENVHRHYLR